MWLTIAIHGELQNEILKGEFYNKIMSIKLSLNCMISYSLLMKMKIWQYDTAQTLRYVLKIVTMSVNERHLTMAYLQSDAQECVDSLSNIVFYL